MVVISNLQGLLDRFKHILQNLHTGIAQALFVFSFLVPPPLFPFLWENMVHVDFILVLIEIYIWFEHIS